MKKNYKDGEILKNYYSSNQALNPKGFYVTIKIKPKVKERILCNIE